MAATAVETAVVRLPVPHKQYGGPPSTRRPQRQRGGRRLPRAEAPKLPSLGPEQASVHPSAPSKPKQPRNLRLPKVRRVPFFSIKALESWSETPTPAASPTPATSPTPAPASPPPGNPADPASDVPPVKLVNDALNETSRVRPWVTNYRRFVVKAVGCPPEVPQSTHAGAVFHRSASEKAAAASGKIQATASVSLSPSPSKKWVSPALSSTTRGHGGWLDLKRNCPSPDREARRLLQRGQPLYRNATADTRRHIREAIREAFSVCKGAPALKEVSDVAIKAVEGNVPNTDITDIDLSNATTEEVAAMLAQRIDEGISLHLPWVPRDAWLTVVQQLLDQESKYVQPQLVMGAAASMGVLDKRAMIGRRRSIELSDMNSFNPSAKFNSNMSSSSTNLSPKNILKSRSTKNFVDEEGGPSKHPRPTAGGADQQNVAIACPQQPPDPKRERRWRNAFCRLVDAGRVRREALPRALELAGFHGARQDVIDSVFGEITKVSSLGAEEYMRFVRHFEQRQQMQVYTAFMEADADGSGCIDSGELKEMLIRFGIEPLRVVIDSVMKEVDDDGSQQLSYSEFEKLMTILRTREGFTKDDDEKFDSMFNRFDKEHKGHIGTSGLCGALSWLGYNLSQEECDKVTAAIDIDGSGNIDYHEFLMCMRKVREREIEYLKTACQELDQDDSGTMNVIELEELFRRLGYIPNREALLEIIEESEFESELGLDDLWELLQLYRSREGLTRAEYSEVEAAFNRYDTSEIGEISVLDVGKALRWFGYPMSFDDQQYLIALVDIDKSGKLDVSELRKLIRMHRDEECRRMQNTFCEKMKATESEGALTLSVAEARNAYRDLGLMDLHGKLPPIPNECINVNGAIEKDDFVRIGMQHKKKAREAYRKNGGYSHDEIRGLQQVFQEYDTDHSGNITNDELGCLIKDLFPVMSPDVRLLLDELMREITMNGSGSLDFQDFIRIMRQFHDIQTQEQNNKERQAIEESGFRSEEVQDFREMFLAVDECDVHELMLSDIKKMLMNICVIGDKQLADLAGHFREVSKRWGKSEDHRDRIDFPEFLLLMKKLIEVNFANIKSQIGWTRGEE